MGVNIDTRDAAGRLRRVALVHIDDLQQGEDAVEEVDKGVSQTKERSHHVFEIGADGHAASEEAAGEMEDDP
jgi:hypothetical protein